MAKLGLVFMGFRIFVSGGEWGWKSGRHYAPTASGLIPDADQARHMMPLGQIYLAGSEVQLPLSNEMTILRRDLPDDDALVAKVRGCLGDKVAGGLQWELAHLRGIGAAKPPTGRLAACAR
jgi:hypothetical protein